jgi:hypothetical protein
MLSNEDINIVIDEMKTKTSEIANKYIIDLMFAKDAKSQSKAINSFENTFRVNLESHGLLGSEPPRLVFKRRFVPFAVWYLLNISETATADEIIRYAENNDLMRKEWVNRQHMPKKLGTYMSQSCLFEICGRTKEKNSRNIWRLKK